MGADDEVALLIAGAEMGSLVLGEILKASAGKSACRITVMEAVQLLPESVTKQRVEEWLGSIRNA